MKYITIKEYVKIRKLDSIAHIANLFRKMIPLGAQKRMEGKYWDINSPIKLV